MDNNLSIISYNCKYLGRDKFNFINKLKSKCDFLLLQEHCLYESEFCKRLNIINKDLECVVSSEMDETIPLVGRPKGGCAIIWSSRIKVTAIEKLNIENDKICGIHVKQNNMSFVLFNIYMPCDTRTRGLNLIKYNDILNEISVICNTIDEEYIVIAGDFNTDLDRDSFCTDSLKSFINNEQLYFCSDFESADVPYTFMSKGNGVQSKIDHAIVSENLCDLILQYKSLFLEDDFSDHVPILLQISVNTSYFKVKSRISKPRVAWHKANDQNHQSYKE